MKTSEILKTVGVIVGFGALLRFINWILESLGFSKNLDGSLVFILSVLFSTIIIIIIILINQNEELKKIKGFLKKKGFKEKKDGFEKMFEIKKNKKGSIAIDPRILFWIIVIILGYLFLKSIGVFN